MATIRIDDDLKKEADDMFEEVGMNTSTAVKIFLTRFVKTGKFPFDIEVMDHQPNEASLKAFEETERMIEQGNLENTEGLSNYFKRMKKEADSDA